MKHEESNEQIINKINPTPANLCPKCDSKIMVMMGVVVCTNCNWKKDLYRDNQ